MTNRRIAQPAHEPTTRQDRWRAIQERTTRGLLTFNAGGVVCLEGDLWAVRSATHGGFHRVDLGDETCTCEDFVHRGRADDMNCRHIYAVAIAHATRRCPRRSQRRPSCPSCFGGYVTITVEEDGLDALLAVPCRRCKR
ncbi:MAG: SWIM zinc finger family protein [Rubrobacter sp.]|nr:SWIM zinc finger family protein [Rubrobacter sp.]